MSVEDSPTLPAFPAEAGQSLVGTSLHVGRGLMAYGGSKIQVDGNVTYNVTSQYNPDLIQRLIDSLSFEGMDDRRLDVADECKHTCEWLLRTSQWTSWQGSFKSQHPRLLWVKGKAGTGKSTLMKYAIERGHIGEPGEIVLVHFFNARGSELEKSTEGMYRTLLVQLIESLLPDPKLHIKYVRSILPHGGNWRLGRLKELFNKIVRANTHKRITCFVDALDECDETQAQQMIDDFCAFMDSAEDQPVSLRVCLASRYFPHITVPGNTFHPLPIAEQDGHKADIARFIEQKLKVNNHRLAGIIRTRLQEKANGVFLWCALVISIVNKKARQGELETDDEVQNTLNGIPEELSDLLENILGLSKSSQYPPDSRLLLCMQWIVFTQEALTPGQLWEAVQLGEMAQYQETRLIPPSDEVVALFILHVSRGLVEIGQKHVQVIHESVRDFLLNEGGLARLMCLDGTVPRNTEFASALSHDVLKDICPSRPFVRTELFRVGSAATEWQPLLVEYAKKWMMYHANEAQTSGLVDQEHFLEELKSNWAYWHSALRSPDVAVALMNYGLPSLIRLHCLQTNRAADGSAEKMLRRLAASGCYLNIGDWYHNCAVALRALTEEHISAQDRGTRRYVLEQIAVEIDWQSLASKAVYSHHTFSMLFRLLERSVSIGAFFLVALAPKDRLSAMCRVAGFRDFHKMLTAILRTDVSVHDIFEDEISGSEVLCWASSKGHCELVQILVAEPGLSVNTRWDKSTPLHWAIQSRQKTVVEFLLKNTDTDVNCYDRSSRTALHMAVEQGDHDTLKMLLSRPEIDVNARDGGGNDATPLQLAVQAGDAIVLGLLLDRREIDVNTWDQSGETPLMSAIASRNKECVRRLFETGRVDVNRKDRWGWTFLHWAVIAGDVSIIETLLSICKLDLRIRDDSGSTPIQLAHANGNKEVYDLLAKADRETTNGTSSQGRVSWSVDDMIRMSTVPM